MCSEKDVLQGKKKEHGIFSANKKFYLFTLLHKKQISQWNNNNGCFASRRFDMCVLMQYSF